MCVHVQIPTVGFLYIAGWIGYVGRDYLIASKKESKPRDKEIIIDVPMALKMAVQVSNLVFCCDLECQCRSQRACSARTVLWTILLDADSFSEHAQSLQAIPLASCRWEPCDHSARHKLAGKSIAWVHWKDALGL